MRTRATRRQGELNRRRLRPWQAAAACAVTLASLVMFGAGMPQSPAQASTQTATASAPVPVVGVQDGWINSPVASGAAAKVTRSPATLGIHDGAINRCDGSGKLQKHPVRINVAGADASFGSPLWSALNVTTVRYSPPWDVAEPTADPSLRVQQLLQVNEQCLAAWLIDAAKATPAITSVEIAFRPDGYYTKTARGTIKRGGHSKLQAAIPSLRTYQGAVQQFLDAFTCSTATCQDKVAVPGLANQGLGMAMAPVKIIAPWGEPDYGRGVYEMPSGDRGDTFDNPACPNKATVANCGPELAAGMYNYVRQHCTACTQVIAGDFGSGASADPGQTFSRGQKLGDYLRVYYRNLRDAKDVTVWGLHPYGDVEYAQKLWWDRRHGKGGPAAPAPSGTRVYSFAAALKQLNPRNSTKIHIWLDEISSFNGKGQGNHHYQYFTRASQAYGAQWLFDTLVRDVPAHGPVVTNVYYLNFSGPGSTNAELINPPATSHPVYDVFKAANN